MTNPGLCRCYFFFLIMGILCRFSASLVFSRSAAQRGLRLFASSSSSKLINPTVEWKGASHSNSEHVTHVIVKEPSTVDDSVNHALQQRPDASPYTAKQLLELGSIWYLPVTAPRDPSQGTKPIRLTQDKAAMRVEHGD
jgi:hypothetical protein